ncbi:rhodanese-like domain-containing protein [Roseibium aggregatum]|uniref:Rhodanese-like domain-containing protein n=1 Tax=Roseibium aggregatum TaxID=187304 RepID=A0A926P365_9HYPH|nr:rhodanese-like domain-containing protein [Roseibium aggregatum]MBD1548733.1 rhodanese-like domain-containing protein [Roseibium aggregatum]
MHRGFFGLLALGLTFAVPAAAADNLKITGDETVVTIETDDGVVDITRQKTEAALIGGVLQPMVPVPGVTPVGELEVLDALKTKSAKVVDMRTLEWRTKSTIPGSIHIPYTEVAMRLNELGCSGSQGAWDCANADKMIAFCNGPACPQSPTAIKAMAREGYPPEKIFYYRGGMQDWVVLGLTVAEDMF